MRGSTALKMGGGGREKEKRVRGVVGDGEIAKLTRPRHLLCGQDAPFPWLCRTSLVPPALSFYDVPDRCVEALMVVAVVAVVAVVVVVVVVVAVVVAVRRGGGRNR